MNGYPDFPKTNLPSDVSFARLDKVAKSTTEGGYTQTRLKTKRAMWKYTLKWAALPQDQLEILKEFDRLTGYGSKEFDYVLPPKWNDSTPKRVRMEGELSYSRVGRRHVPITITLVEV